MQNEIIFWLGCFWWVQKYFDQIQWVVRTEVGYAWGKQDHVTYDDIGDHTEVVKVAYDPNIISLRSLAEKFIEKKDPSFPWYKTQYDSLVVYNTQDEQDIMNMLLSQYEIITGEKSNVRVEKIHTYFRAEEYHQDYFKKQS